MNNTKTDDIVNWFAHQSDSTRAEQITAIERLTAMNDDDELCRAVMALTEEHLAEEVFAFVLFARDVQPDAATLEKQFAQRYIATFHSMRDMWDFAAWAWPEWPKSHDTIEAEAFTDDATARVEDVFRRLAARGVQLIDIPDGFIAIDCPPLGPLQ